MAAYLFKRALVAVGADYTAFDGGDMIRSEEVTLSYASGEANKVVTGGQAMGTIKTHIGGLEGSVTVKFPMAGSAAAGTAPRYGALLTAAGMSETIVAVTSVTYETDNDSPTTSELMVQVPEIDGGDSYEIVLTEAAGVSVTFEAERNGPMFCTVEMKGVFQAPTNETAIPPTGMDTIIPTAFKGTTTTLHSFNSLIIDGFTFTMENEVGMRPSMGASSGFVGAIRTSRKCSGTISPEIPATTAFDPYTIMVAETIAAMSFSAIGSGAGNVMTISFPQTQIVGVTLAERAGILTGEIALDYHEALSATGGSADEISIVFT